KSPAPVAPMRSPLPPGVQSAGMLEMRIPWISEEAAVIALSSMRSLTRAPEVKMLLLTPLFMLVIFGGLLWRNSADIPDAARPLILFGAMAMTLFTMWALGRNMFGYG